MIQIVRRRVSTPDSITSSRPSWSGPKAFHGCRAVPNSLSYELPDCFVWAMWSRSNRDAWQSWRECRAPRRSLSLNRRGRACCRIKLQTHIRNRLPLKRTEMSPATNLPHDSDRVRQMLLIFRTCAPVSEHSLGE